MMYQVFVISLLIAAVTADHEYSYQASGQASARLIDQKVFEAKVELGPFDLDGGHGIVMKDNKLLIQQTGLYYVYGQVHYIHLNAKGQLYNRVRLLVNSKPFRFLQQGMDGRADIGNVYSGGIIALNKGDTISLRTQTKAQINMDPKVTFFGAFKIAFGCHECGYVPVYTHKK